MLRFQHDSSSHSSCECFVCGWQGDSELAATSDLWVCLICGFTGCGATHGPFHIQAHYAQTLHAYAMNTENRRVWDFAGEGYVHRLILNGPPSSALETATSSSSGGGHAGKMVEGPTGSGSGSQHEGVRDQRAPLSLEQEEMIVNRKLESAAYHYNQLVAWQMQQNRLKFETRLQRIRESMTPLSQSAASSTLQSDWQSNLAVSLRQEHAKVSKQIEAAEERLLRAEKELSVHRELNANLLRNQTDWQSRVQAASDKYKATEQAIRYIVI